MTTPFLFPSSPPYKFKHTEFFKLTLPLHSIEQVKNSIPRRTWWELNRTGLVGTEMTKEHTVTQKRLSLLTLCFSSPARHHYPQMTTPCGLSCYFSGEARNPEYLDSIINYYNIIYNIIIINLLVCKCWQ